MNKSMEALVVFVFVFASLVSMIATDKPPTLSYGIIGKNNAPPSSTMNGPPVNHPTRGCNSADHCRQYTLIVQNPSGSRVEAVAIVKGVNSSEAGTEAIAAGLAAWSLNKSNHNGCGLLIVSNQTSGDSNSLTSAERLQIKAVSRGIRREGLDVQYWSASMSTEDAASLLPVDGNVTIAVNGTASKQVELKLFTRVESLGENDMEYILKRANATLAEMQKKKDCQC